MIRVLIWMEHEVPALQMRASITPLQCKQSKDIKCFSYLCGLLTLWCSTNMLYLYMTNTILFACIISLAYNCFELE